MKETGMKTIERRGERGKTQRKRMKGRKKWGRRERKKLQRMRSPNDPALLCCWLKVKNGSTVEWQFKKVREKRNSGKKYYLIYFHSIRLNTNTFASQINIDLFLQKQ